MSGSNVKVAISDDFFGAFAALPRSQQGKISRFIEEFRKNPKSSGINYEKLKQVTDPNMRSVRIDKAYRGIVLKPEVGNVYILLWVDHHDKAYDWAARKIVKVNSESGSLQVIDTENIKRAAASIERSEEKKGLFAAIKDKHLKRIGVPEEALDLVKSVESERDLDKLGNTLPQEASEGLFMLAAGYSIEEAQNELELASEAETKVDTDDIGSSLENPDSKRRFYTVDDDLELQAMLNAPLDKWRIFLHPTQRKLVNRHWNGPVRVLGGAGTGKTVVAMHRAKWLAENICPLADDRVLFTTFTRNLAEDVKANLEKLCTPEILEKMEVRHLDGWVNDTLKKHGYSFDIDYGAKSKELWERALASAPSEFGLSQSFYREEWDHIISPNGIMALTEYFQISRVGRGTQLDRKKRKAVWSVFEEYRNLLRDNNLKEANDAMIDVLSLMSDSGQYPTYKAVVVDEAQDLGNPAFKLIKGMLEKQNEKDSLFIVGDGHQRIYGRKVVLGKCGIKIVGRSRRLRLNYRTTEETRSWAADLLKGQKIDDLDGGTDDQKGYKSLLKGAPPVQNHSENFEAELKFIADIVKEIGEEHRPNSCLVLRTNELVDQYQAGLADFGIKSHKISRGKAENRLGGGLRIATMHRVKGLEFNHVIISSVNEGVVPLNTSEAKSADPVVKREYDLRERSLLFVAATRAKRSLYITSHGSKSSFLT